MKLVNLGSADLFICSWHFSPYKTGSRLLGEVFNETIYEKFISNIIKYPIILVVFSNYQKANFYVQKRIDKIIELGYGYDQNGSIVYLNNVIFIFYEKSLNKSTFGFISWFYK